MSASIQDMYHNIKRVLRDDVYFYTLLIIVVSILSFELGRLSMEGDLSTSSQQAVLIEQPAAADVSESNMLTKKLLSAENSQLVASRKGTKYHLLTCPGAKQMSEENKIYFISEDEARASGYTPAANCSF